MSIPLEQKRNVALVGHLGSGKTMLAEAMLFAAGVTTRMGSIEDGNTVSDRDAEEVKRRYSIRSTVLPFDYANHRLTVIDCPGYLDFAGEMISGLNAVDAAVIVVSGAAGVEPQTRRAWRECEKLGLPRVLFVSGLDKENSSWDKALHACRQAFGKSVAPLFMPIGGQHGLRGVIDILRNKAFIKDGDKVIEGEVPADYAGRIAIARTALVESIVELDEALLERYLADEPIGDDELAQALRNGTQLGAVYPVIGGAGKQLIGVGNLLDLIADCLPHPGFKKHIVGAKPNGSEDTRPLREEAPFCARVFKIAIEGQLGEVFWMRVYSGKIRPGESVYNMRSGDLEKVSTLLVMRGKTREDLTEAGAGDIVGTVKMKATHLGDTLGIKEAPFYLPPVEFPTAVAYEAVDVADKNDLEKVMAALNNVAAMDPTLKVMQHEETKEQVVSGMGQVHLDISAALVKAKTGVELKWHKPRVPYRETITETAEAQGKYKKQTGGRGKYGDVHLRLEPLERGAGFAFVDAIVGGVVPNRFIPAVEKGVIETMENGPLSGSRVIDMRVTLFYGSYHSVDSDELSFKVAASLGFKGAFEKCRPIILEPIYDVTIYTPEEYMGDVMADINTRRGRVGGMDQQGDLKVITAQVPLGELYQYINTLRSLTQGRGYYEMKFATYEQVPSPVQAEIIKAHQATRTAEKET
jgi:elongation factor G